jgi:GNAT superfamily N-acetyltransferase
MPVADLEDVATRASAIASDATRPASERVAELRRLDSSIPTTSSEVRGRIDSLIGTLELQREAEALVGVTEILIARENADIREELLERELATPDELDAAGYFSHETLDRKTTDGTLQEAFGAIDPVLLAKLAARRRRSAGGQFADEFSSLAAPGPPKLKGRGGAALPGAKGTPKPGGVPGQRNEYSAPENPMPSPKPNVGAPGKPDAAPFEAEAGSHPLRPVKVGGDVQKAAQLDQTRAVSTLLDELAEMVRQAEAAGDKAPNFDLCKVSVPGTNLFCADTKGYGRLEMPQLGGKPLPGTPAAEMEPDSRGDVDLAPAFRDMLQAQGVEVTDETVPASHLRASQNELNGAKVAGIAGAIRGPGLEGETRIYVSSDDYIVDGHHRWAAYVGVDADDNELGDITMDVTRVDMPITELLHQANAFTEDMGMPSRGIGDDSAPPLTDDPAAYIDFDPDKHPVVDVSKLKRTKPDQPDSTAEAIRRMTAASKGEIPKRKPIDVIDNEDGTFDVVDGNGTTEAAEVGGLTSMPVNVLRTKKNQQIVTALESFEDPETGLKLGNTRTTASNGRVDFTSDVLDGDKKVGKVMRILKPDGTLTRDQTRLDDEYQRKGFASRLMDHEEGVWRDAGAKKLDMVPISDSSKGFAEKHGFTPGEGFKVERPIRPAEETDAGSAAGEDAGAVMPDPFTEDETSKPEQTFASVEEMFEAAKADEASFKALLTEALAPELDALVPATIEEAVENAEQQPDKAQVVMGPMKKMERAMDKINGKYGGDHNRLQDVLRATVTVPTLADFPEMVDQIRRAAQANGYEIRKAENRFLDPPPPHNVGATPSGYRDAAIALVSPGGVVTEVQMNTTPMFAAKQGEGHTMYEESRKIAERMTPASPGTTGVEGSAGVSEEDMARLRELERLSTELYDAAYEASLA